MPRVKDQTTGKYTTVYSDREIIDFLASEGFAGTREVADKLGCDRSHAYRRLSDLESENRIVTRLIGGNCVYTAEDNNGGETE